MSMLVQLLEKFNAGQFDSLAVNLQRILYNHFRRIGQFHKALITRPLRKDYDYEVDADYQACTFGRWYYSQAAPELMQNKQFIELGKIHEDLHTRMGDLLRKVRNDVIAADDYDRFLKTYNLFTDKLTELINEINFAQYQFDPLTKLLNRRAFKKILEYESSLLQRNKKRPSCVAMVDIDHFKKVNDTYGHASGDAVLKALAGMFLKHLRGYDTVGRFGGEEFIFCLPNTALILAKKIMERLRKKVEHSGVPLTDGSIIHITLSIGIAELKASGAIDKTLHSVDQALYKAKESGRNRVEAALS